MGEVLYGLPDPDRVFREEVSGQSPREKSLLLGYFNQEIGLGVYKEV